MMFDCNRNYESWKVGNFDRADSRCKHPSSAIEELGPDVNTPKVLQQYNPLEDLIRLYYTIQHNERLNRTA